jgi:thiamine-phosphate pyrophosphorylase
VKLHVLVDEYAVARRAVRAGATVVQLRVKGASTADLVERGRSFPGLGATFVVNDDVEAALELGADGVHLGRTDEGVDRAQEHGLTVGVSASDVGEAVAAERLGASYIGAGPIWATPSKPDAARPIGLDGLAGIVGAVSVPVVAIGGIDATNAATCIAAGAAGVAVIRAAGEAGALRRAIDAAFGAR